ncbi:MAG: transposase [Vicinamibacteria bacterium]|nr:transposase [Vicinamibacteria bacterium]
MANRVVREAPEHTAGIIVAATTMPRALPLAPFEPLRPDRGTLGHTRPSTSTPRWPPACSSRSPARAPRPPAPPPMTLSAFGISFKAPWRSGTAHADMDAHQFLARLCALVPPPGFHMTRY